jgi:O-succinylhomoserine sulfhydrylase
MGSSKTSPKTVGAKRTGGAGRTGVGKEARLATKLVQGGLQRSNFSETSEAIFMTSGYVYASAEEAEAAFASKNAHYIYSRFSNPTVQMFEERMALLEGADGIA